MARADFWRQAVGSEHSVETPFTFGEPSNRLVSGVVDLMFNVAGGWQVIDYKTDVELSARAGAYQEQLKAYERALASCGLSPLPARVAPVRENSGS